MSEGPSVGPDHEVSRRRFLLGFGWGGILALFAAGFPGVARFLWPQGGGDAATVVVLGTPADCRAAAVTTRWLKRHGLWIVREGGRLFALEARCTHLGCTPRWTPEQAVFRCPCHGSQFSTDGAALMGPATLPLQRLSIRLEQGRIVVDRSQRASMEQAERDARFYLTI